MRFGFRKPSFRKSFRARTTGRLKRQYKKALNPWYGRKGMGYIHNPRKAVYNGVYHRTTASPIPRSHTRAYRHDYYMKHKYGYVPSDDTQPPLTQFDLKVIAKDKQIINSAKILKKDEETPTTKENEPIKDLHVLDASESNSFKEVMGLIVPISFKCHKYTQPPRYPSEYNIDEICLMPSNKMEAWQFDRATDGVVPYDYIDDMIHYSESIYRVPNSFIVTNGKFKDSDVQFCRKMNIKYPDLPIRLYDRQDLIKILGDFEANFPALRKKDIRGGYTEKEYTYPLSNARDIIIRTANEVRKDLNNINR